jgi:hypothetical protein
MQMSPIVVDWHCTQTPAHPPPDGAHVFSTIPAHVVFLHLPFGTYDTLPEATFDGKEKPATQIAIAVTQRLFILLLRFQETRKRRSTRSSANNEQVPPTVSKTPEVWRASSAIGIQRGGDFIGV